MRSVLHAAACCLAALVTAPAQAVPVTYEFSGFVSFPDSIGSYSHDFGVPFNTAFSGQVTLESETTPYYEDATQRNYFDLLTSMDVQFGADGSFGMYSGPGGLQVPPPWGWNSSSMGIATGFYADGTPYDQVALYGSITQRPVDAPNAFYRFELWGVSSQNVFDTFPSLDNLPDKEAFGALPMGFNLIATQYDDAGAWLGHTALHGNVTNFKRVTSVPEPSTGTLLLAGFLAVVAAMRRHRQAATAKRIG